MIPVSTGVPAHCQYHRLAFPEIAFEVSLPSAWNGRFYMIGNRRPRGRGARRSRAASRSAMPTLQLGFAFARPNTGHDSRKEPGGTFVLSNPQKAIDYAYRAVHLTATTAKDITKDYYGQAVVALVLELVLRTAGVRACSRRSAYPDDFDGIVANARWVDQTGFTHGRDVESARAEWHRPVPQPKPAFWPTRSWHDAMRSMA